MKTLLIIDYKCFGDCSCPRVLSIAMIKHWQKTTWGESVASYRLQFIKERRQELKQKPQRNAAYWLAFTWPAQCVFFIQLSTTCLRWFYPGGLGPPTSIIIKKMPCRLTCRPVSWRRHAPPWIEVPSSQMTPPCIMNLTKT